MLPSVRKAAKEDAANSLLQSSLDPHLRERSQAEPRPAPYSDDLMRDATIQWLVETDQVRVQLYSPKTGIEMISSPLLCLSTLHSNE